VNLAEPLLLREVACGSDGTTVIHATPLEFIPIHQHPPADESASWPSKHDADSLSDWLA
jgi:hypothetical protein